MPDITRVGMAQLVVCRNPTIIETQALGSCVGVTLYDHNAQIGGMLHAMLPSMSEVKENSRGNLAKFVDTALDDLFKKMLEQGAAPKHIKAKIAGGANMFPDITNKNSLHIGKRNINATKQKLDELNIPIEAEDTGGSVGRTISLDTQTGKLKVRTIALGEKEI